MAYEDSAVGVREGDERGATASLPSAESRYQGEGFRLEPDFREAGGTGENPLVPAPGSGEDGESTLTLGTLGRRVPPTPNLDYVFDDPADGEPGPDRMLVHGVWELLLALAVAAVGYLLYRQDSGAFGGDGLKTLLLSMTMLGALAVGSALALRAGVPNLAIGTVSVAAGLYFAQHSHGGLAKPIGVVIGICALVGLVQGLAVVALHVPAWAASLGAATGLVVWVNWQSASTMLGGYLPERHTYYWFGGFCAISAFGGLIGLVPSIRRGLGRFRPVEDPALRRGGPAGFIALLATIGSTVLGGIAGVLATAEAGTAVTSDGLLLTAFGLGAALLGGTSAFGRRGGIFGTIFAVGLITVVMAYFKELAWTWPPAAFAAIAIGLGLVITRLVERFGRPPQLDDEELDESEDWTPPRQQPVANGWSSRQPAWQTATGSSPTVTAAAGGLWGADESWGASERR